MALTEYVAPVGTSRPSRPRRRAAPQSRPPNVKVNQDGRSRSTLWLCFYRSGSKSGCWPGHRRGIGSSGPLRHGVRIKLSRDDRHRRCPLGRARGSGRHADQAGNRAFVARFRGLEGSGRLQNRPDGSQAPTDQSAKSPAVRLVAVWIWNRKSPRPSPLTSLSTKVWPFA